MSIINFEDLTLSLAAFHQSQARGVDMKISAKHLFDLSIGLTLARFGSRVNPQVILPFTDDHGFFGIRIHFNFD